MEKRVLISVFTVSALLFGLFCVFPMSSALSDDMKIKDDEHLRHSFPMLDRKRKKRAIGAAIRVVIPIISFVTSNIRQAFGNSGTEKSHQQLIDHFKQIHDELEQQKDELKSINLEIKKLGSYVTYFHYESKIRDSLWTLREYLHNPNEQNRNIFINKAAGIDHSIRVLIDGLLGQNNFSPDIMAIMQDATECRGRNKLLKSVHSVESLVMTGLYVRREYQRIAINATEFLKESPFKNYIDTSVTKLEKRLNDKVVECYADEKNVGVEMHRILKAKLTQGREVVADSLLEFLEEKYDNKKWIVITQINNSGDLDSVWTGGFHQATVKNHVVLALSVDRDRDFTEFKNLIHAHLKEFNIPTKSSVSPGSHKWHCLGSLRIEEHLKRFLIPVLAESGIEIETLVSVDTHPQKDLIIKTSKEVEEQQVISMNNMPYIPQSCLYKGRDIRFYSKPSYWMILIPTKRLRNPTKCSYSSDNLAHQDYGPLRNEYSQAYLSVKGDSNKEGAYIVMDRQWRNSPGQKWKFVNGQLKNGFGKCFTKWSPVYQTIYQYDCHHNWEGQKWYRHGLQIANGNDGPFQCLFFDGNVQNNPYIWVPEGGICNTLPSFLWYNRNTDCEDAMVIPPSTNKSRTLRNEFSRLFLGVEAGYGRVKPWINRPTQRWKFVDGLLRNDDGKCLIGKRWYVQEVDCDSGRMGNNGLWTYTENRQIRSYDGYCLSSGGDQYGYVYYDYCKDESSQHWR
uniref:Ricin B lectin domain-containing protein n=1 Tax=Daphnia galeata TaxID=27404 RepID=A0A8J2W662_9CRUS|nr:unnamed protein product [Daphnia galeata]